jgi:predicted MFS family arabinose efflux permease
VNAGYCLGILLTNLLASNILPSPEMGEALSQDENWRIVYALPIATSIVAIALISTLFRIPLINENGNVSDEQLLKIYEQKDLEFVRK